MLRTPARCYHFISHRTIRAALGDRPRRDVRWIPARPGTVCAEIGSGGGFYTAELARRLGPQSLLVALDPAAADTPHEPPAAPGARIAYIAGDGCALPFATASLDALLYSYSLEEMPDARAALTEAERVLRPGGQVVLFLWRPVLHARRATSVLALCRERFEVVRAERGMQNLRLACRKP
ncbi:class I SAM-dependent methyltransferase [Streptomyces sp. NPDC001262]|uniref:class I SAM-dependent methyltransferase n=1 Tax=Streptomyces sp. NPDC001262 TaxID=3364552 RepID=UPI0036CE04DF